MTLGSDEDALRLLSYAYPVVSAAEIVPGAVPVVLHSLIVYCRARLGEDATGDLRAASAGFPRYVFRSRWSSFPVLKVAGVKNSTPRFLSWPANWEER